MGELNGVHGIQAGGHLGKFLQAESLPHVHQRQNDEQTQQRESAGTARYLSAFGPFLGIHSVGQPQSSARPQSKFHDVPPVERPSTDSAQGLKEISQGETKAGALGDNSAMRSAPTKTVSLQYQAPGGPRQQAAPSSNAAASSTAPTDRSERPDQQPACHHLGGGCAASPAFILFPSLNSNQKNRRRKNRQSADQRQHGQPIEHVGKITDRPYPTPIRTHHAAHAQPMPPSKEAGKAFGWPVRPPAVRIRPRTLSAGPGGACSCRMTAQRPGNPRARAGKQSGRVPRE
jgi:hypothetical protein